MGDFVTIATYDTRIQAELARGLLNSEGIQAIIQADDEGGMMAYPFSLVRGVRLQVAANDQEKAEKVIKQNGS